VIWIRKECKFHWTPTGWPSTWEPALGDKGNTGRRIDRWLLEHGRQRTKPNNLVTIDDSAIRWLGQQTGAQLGERAMARDFDLQVTELQVRAAVLNRFTRLGTLVTVPML
jgi:hypothetical protein